MSLLIPLEGDAHVEGWPPGQESFNSRPLFPGVLPDWVNNHAFQALVGALIVIGLWWWVSTGLRVVPTKKQAYGEFFYDLVRNSIARDILGHDFRRFLPVLLALFSFILVNNLFGVSFFFMFPTFSKIGYVYGLALFVWLLYNGVGIWKHGFFGYLKHATLPSGVPPFLWWLIIPLEFLSNIIVRPITLALRLFANLFAGHLVVLVFVMGGSILLSQANLLFKGAGLVAWIFSFGIFALEILVSIIQAYIFTVLTAQYVSSSLAEDH